MRKNRRIKTFLRKHPGIPLYHLAYRLNILAHIAVIMGSIWIDFFPPLESLQQLIGTGAEIIAGIYGITLSGYVFFLSRIDALAASDFTLEDVVYDMKETYKYMIWGISANVLVALIGCGLILYYPYESGILPPYVFRLICNESLLFLLNSVLFIFYYTLCVIDPKCLERAASNLKKKLSEENEICGDVSEFFMDYDKIDAHCRSLLKPGTAAHLQNIDHCHPALIHELLREQKCLEDNTLDDIVCLRKYHNCMLNCKPIAVSQEMCDMARKVLGKLIPPQQKPAEVVQCEEMP